ncbi:MAG: NADP oxidoreductase [Desulfomonilaceae bacterium]
MIRRRLATAWLDGCSGCHMSFLDIDERIMDLLDRLELVYCPLIDVKTIPEGIDFALVEGAVSSLADKEEILSLREKAEVLIAFGDCAVTANVPGMRNQFKVVDTLSRSYIENSLSNPMMPGSEVPKLMEYAKPLHEYVRVDLFLPGCPPPADVIFSTLRDLIDGRPPVVEGRTRFGA